MGDFDLVHGKNILSIFNFSYFPDDEKGGNAYNTSFLIRIISEDFSGVGEFECDIKEFRKFAEEINELFELKRFEVLFKEICYGSTIKFKINRIGHLEISGEIFGTHMLQCLKFSFIADQTSLNGFADSIKHII